MQKKKQYERYRVFITSSGKFVIGGKSAEQNEELVASFIGKENIILHTDMPGSPFCVILGKNKLAKSDIKEAAVFCARHSRDWKKNHKDVIVHVFTGKDAYKDRKMKAGTFGVRKIKAKIKASKRDINNFENKKC